MIFDTFDEVINVFEAWA